MEPKTVGALGFTEQNPEIIKLVGAGFKLAWCVALNEREEIPGRLRHPVDVIVVNPGWQPAKAATEALPANVQLVKSHTPSAVLVVYG